MKTIKKAIKHIGIIVLLFLTFNSIRIYRYSFEYSEKKSDVAIVLGAGTNKGILSPVFEERINHGIYLYEKSLVRKIIFTGGKGKGQDISDSQIAKHYAIEKGVLENDILIDQYSNYTYENLTAAKRIMDTHDYTTALIVSDPLHMKRSMELAIATKIECEPSPTKTSMYRTIVPRFKFLMYETFFYSFGKILFQH